MSLKSKNWKYLESEDLAYIDYETAPEQMKEWASLIILGYSMSDVDEFRKIAQDCRAGKKNITYIICHERSNTAAISFSNFEDRIIDSLNGKFYEIPVFYAHYFSLDK